MSMHCVRYSKWALFEYVFNGYSQCKIKLTEDTFVLRLQLAHLFQLFGRMITMVVSMDRICHC